jgi:hypothetical protein
MRAREAAVHAVHAVRAVHKRSRGAPATLLCAAFS